MPTYEYLCKKCGHEFETLQSISARPLGSVSEESLPAKKMGPWPGKTQNQRRRRSAVQRQRLLYHRLPQREAINRRLKRIPRRPNRPAVDAKPCRQARQQTCQADIGEGLTMFHKRCLRDLGCAAVLFGVFCGNAFAQLSLPDMNLTRSVSGQFIVTGDRAGIVTRHCTRGSTNADFVRLEPALLAVSAERIKQTLWRTLGVDSTAPWRGKIFLALHPARSLDEDVTVLSEHFADGWNYRVALPDVLPRTRFLRALTGVTLLEFANRGAGRASGGDSRLADRWFVTTVARDRHGRQWFLSSPGKVVNGVWESWTDATSARHRPAGRCAARIARSPGADV